MTEKNELYERIENKIIDEEVYQEVKDYSKNNHRLRTYYEVGEMLAEAGKHYGESIIKEYALKLEQKFGKKYNTRTLYRIRQFYIIFSNPKVSPVATQLTWSHYTEVLSLKDINKIQYYLDIAIKNNLTKRELRTKIKSKEYERLPDSTKKKIINEEKIDIKESIPDPIILYNLQNEEIVNEKALHQLILENIELFLKELGSGYSFIGSEYKIKIDKRYNYIDLLLYNYKFKSFVVVELKVTELKSPHIGQIEKYINYVDENIKDISDNNTIGIIIVKKNNQYVIKYASDPRILAREYQIN